MSDKKTRDLYHYTSEEGKDGILKDKKIKRSTDIVSDARLGPGVYGTVKSPSTHSQSQIAKNNFDSGWPRKEKAGKVDYAIKVQVPEDKVREVTVPTEKYGDRNILVHDEDIDLNKCNYEVIPVKKSERR